jgi:hypothetical protein
MNTIYYKFFLGALLILTIENSALASSLAVTVNLPNLNIDLNYHQPIRLSKLLSDTQNIIQEKSGDTPFWLMAQLLQNDKNNQINELKNKILAKLKMLSLDHPRSKVKAELLFTFINQNDFNYRYFITLDNDLVRIQTKHNPLLKGQLTLLTPSRVNGIRVIGISHPENPTALIEQNAIDDYLNAYSLPPNSNTELLYIIQPDGVVIKNKNAYWNKKLAFFAPGASLFIGFKSLPNEYEGLNDEIADLIRYITPLSEGTKK